MLVHFTIDPEAISGNTLASTRHEDVLRQLAMPWFDLGILTLSDESACPFFRSINQLPQVLRIQWQHLLTSAAKEGRIRRLASNWPDRYCSINFSKIQQLAPLIELLLAARKNSQELGVPNGQHSGFPPGLEVEVCDYEFPSAAETFRQFGQSRQTAHIDQGEKVLAALKRLFGPPAEVWGEVVVVDRYGLARFAQDRSPTSGVENFLSFLSTKPLTRSITLFVGNTLGIDSEAEFVRLRKLALKYASGTSLTLTVRLVSDKIFKNQHFRYLRFGPEVCWTDEGLQAFEGVSAARYSPCSFRKLDVNIRQIEANLRAGSEEKTIMRTKAEFPSAKPPV